MIKNVIFDFGNVIAQFNKEYILSRFFDGEDDIKLADFVIFRSWDELDSGAVDYTKYTEDSVAKMPGRLEKSTRAFFDDWYKYMPYTDGIEDVVKTLKDEGYPIYLLSNAPAFFSVRRKHFKILEYFDGIVFSGDIKLAKPGVEIYKYLMEKYGLKPEECVFADDLPKNIETARSLGIDGYLFRNDARKFLEYIKKGCEK